MRTRLYLNRWLTFVASCMIQLSGGLSYSFSIYAPALKELWGLRETQLATLGSCFNFGGYLAIPSGALYDRLEKHKRFGPRFVALIGVLFLAAGYGGLYAAASGLVPASFAFVCVCAFLGGNSSTWFDTAAIVTNVRNFPHDRGTVVGILKAFVGLSASVYSSVYAAAFAPAAVTYLGFIASGPPLLVAGLLALVNLVPEAYHEAQPEPGRKGTEAGAKGVERERDRRERVEGAARWSVEDGVSVESGRVSEDTEEEGEEGGEEGRYRDRDGGKGEDGERRRRRRRGRGRRRHADHPRDEEAAADGVTAPLLPAAAAASAAAPSQSPPPPSVPSGASGAAAAAAAPPSAAARWSAGSRFAFAFCLVGVVAAYQTAAALWAAAAAPGPAARRALLAGLLALLGLLLALPLGSGDWVHRKPRPEAVQRARMRSLLARLRAGGRAALASSPLRRYSLSGRWSAAAGEARRDAATAPPPLSPLAPAPAPAVVVVPAGGGEGPEHGVNGEAARAAPHPEPRVATAAAIATATAPATAAATAAAAGPVAASAGAPPESPSTPFRSRTWEDAASATTATATGATNGDGSGASSGNGVGTGGGGHGGGGGGGGDGQGGGGCASHALGDADVEVEAALEALEEVPALPDLPLSAAVRSPLFWLLLFQFSVGLGTGLSVLNNLGSIVVALGGQPGGQVVFVSLFSVANATGRLLGGVLSEALLRRHGTPRTLCLLAASLLTLAGVGGAATSELADLYGTCLVAGLAFGAHWGLIPAITSDLFGLAHFGSNYTGLQLGPAVGGYLLSTVLTGKLYDRAARAHGDRLFCVGADCYFDTWCVLGGLNLLALLGTRELYGLTAPRYRRLVRRGGV